MSTMKKFMKYFILFILFFVFTNIMVKAFLKVSFTDMYGYNVRVENAFIEISEAKVSNRNGYINGMIKNTSNEKIENKYLKVSLISKNDLVIGEKYIYIDKLEIGQVRKFEVKFDYDNVKTFNMEIVDSKPEEVPLFELIKTNANDLIHNNIK